MNDWQIEEVTTQYFRAKTNVDKAKQEYDNALVRLEKMNKVIECDHPYDRLVNVGGFIQNIERCEKCGYEWMY